MARILRGDVLWADLNPVKGHEQAGLRPVLILSPEIFNERSGTVIALALTSQAQKAGFPLTMEITSVALPKPTWVKISQIRTLSVERLGKRMGHVSDDEMSQIVEGLNEIIGEQSAAGCRR
jgi:mRNA interferase MazF